MREELANRLLMTCSDNKNLDELKMSITIILNDYEISPRETAVSVCNEDKNSYYLKKFLIAKTVSGRTERTIDYYKKTLTNIISEIGKPVDEISSDDIRYYLAIRQTRDKISSVTAGNEQRVLKSFFSFLQDEELVLKNPMRKIETIKEERKKKKAFTEMDIEKIRTACRTKRETAMVEFLISSACRVTECSLVKISDINNDKLIVHGKGNKERTVYLNAKAQLAISNYLKERKDNNPYLFAKSAMTIAKTNNLSCKGNPAEWYTHADLVDPSEHIDKSTVENIIRNIGKRAGVEHTHPHRFRRTSATFALRRGMPIEQVSKMLGHESIDTTQIYLDLTEEELQQAHKKFVN